MITEEEFKSIKKGDRLEIDKKKFPFRFNTCTVRGAVCNKTTKRRFIFAKMDGDFIIGGFVFLEQENIIRILNEEQKIS